MHRHQVRLAIGAALLAATLTAGTLTGPLGFGPPAAAWAANEASATSPQATPPRPPIDHQVLNTGDPGLPILSTAVTHEGIVYLLGVTADPGGDVKAQTAQVLSRIDWLLKRAGTDRSRLLTAQVWLADMSDFAALNAVWNAWVDPKNPPVRSCQQAGLWRPGLKVEIMVTAAR